MADMIQIETATRDTAIPQVKQAMTRCQPTFQNVKFLTDGWEEA
jgi:hypothetical protein